MILLLPRLTRPVLTAFGRQEYYGCGGGARRMDTRPDVRSKSLDSIGFSCHQPVPGHLSPLLDGERRGAVRKRTVRRRVPWWRFRTFHGESGVPLASARGYVVRVYRSSGTDGSLLVGTIESVDGNVTGFRSIAELGMILGDLCRSVDHENRKTGRDKSPRNKRSHDDEGPCVRRSG